MTHRCAMGYAGLERRVAAEPLVSRRFRFEDWCDAMDAVEHTACIRAIFVLHDATGL